MKRSFKVMAAALGAVLLLGLVAVGAAFAADPPTTTPTTPTNYYNLFTSKLAGILGIDQKKLTDATTQARNDTIDQMVKDGAITADQAKFMKDRAAWAQANGGPWGFGGPMHGGPWGGRFGGTSGTTPWGTPWGVPPWAATPTPSR
jgi:hypothetical protein